MGTESSPHPVVLASESAPIAYFEGTAGILHANGLFTIGVTVARPVVLSNDTVQIAQSAVAFLKGNRQALEVLRRAIDDALLLGTPVEGEAN
ncbi:hypothetical protein [Xanthobacter versatilis]|uniref:hypothetical protein n=1 Tax=Xanthobacter autotrophicus (strain ATCC BAA-1158 / Py2) TaxID=78245 RepID=UPI0037287583